jgi:hypothetical protein
MSNKYHNSVIYKIKSKDPADKNIYVGSTTNWRDRPIKHKSDCNNAKCKRYNFKVYQHIRGHGGWDCWKAVKVKSYSVNTEAELHAKEAYWMKKLEATLNTVMPCRSREVYRLDNKDKISEYKKQHYIVNKSTISAKHRQYFLDNKESINNSRRVKHNCPCGGQYTTANKLQHMRTGLHQTYLENN